MKDDLSGDLRTIRYQLIETERLIKSSLNAVSRGLKTVETLRDRLDEAELQNLPTSSETPTEHRRHHRAGRGAKIDTGPVLKAFILTRLDALTYHELEQAVANQFPPKRCVGKSAIHAWNKKRLKYLNQT